MKKHLYMLVFTAIGFAACGPTYVVQDPNPVQGSVPQAPPPTPPPAAQPEPSDVTYQKFYDDLSPYGQWIDDPNYGYVWLPDVGPDFKPYATNGHWVYTDEGWAWDSGYPWGWATFHYGRWFFQDGYGWMWIPGNQWAPAWVSWRNSDQYYGWAPMGPNISVNVAYGGGYTPPAHYWCFVPHQYVASPQVNNYYVRESNNVTIINQTTVINNTTIVNNNNTTVINNNTRNVNYGMGPDPNEAGRYAGASIRPVSIRNGSSPGDRSGYGTFTVYRPRINGSAVAENRPGSAASGGRQIAPPRVQTLGNARPVNRTVYGNGNDNRGNDNRGNGNAWGRDNNNNNNNRPSNGFPNRGGYPQGNQSVNQPVNQPVQNQPAQNQPAQNQPFRNQPAQNPPAQNSQPAQNNPYGRPIGRPYQPNPNNQPAQQQPAQQQPMGNQPMGRPVQQQPVYNQPMGRPVQQQPVQQQQPVNNQPVQQQRPAFGRPGFPQANRPIQPVQQQARPVVNQPKPTPAPPPPNRDDNKKDDNGRPGRS